MSNLSTQVVYNSRFEPKAPAARHGWFSNSRDLGKLRLAFGLHTPRWRRNRTMQSPGQYSAPKGSLYRLLLLAGLLGFGANIHSWELHRDREVATGSAAFRVVEKTVKGDRDTRLRLLLPDPAHSRLVVLDNPGNKGYLGELLREQDCLAGANGGYFHPDTRPLGLVISEGNTVHPLVRARLLSGVLVVTDARVSLLRIREFSPSPSPSQALQSGPFLIDRRTPVSGLNDRKRARRTVVLSGGSGRYAIAVTDSFFTLAELAALLATPGIVHEMDITRALNLDGGTSSALWARTAEGTAYLAEAKRVRNFLCLRER